MGDLRWLTYDGKDFVNDFGQGNQVQDLFSNIKFWGEDPNERGIFLKFRNSRESAEEIATHMFKYDIHVPEKSFEQYIDDMGALLIDFYNPKAKLTIGRANVIAKLYIKREKRQDDPCPLIEMRGTFPITMTTNPNIKIGEFDMAMTTNFAI